MRYYDRYNGQMTDNLPIHTDLGRFAVVDKNEVRDLTNVDVVKLGDYVIRESLFEETNQNIHDLLQTISISYERSINEVNPIIQKFNIEQKEFEKLLNKHKSHLRAIVANPHSLLDKNTMKVNIGRAKRISTRSYQHLSHHSEDWEKMSVLSPKPRKILHEELIIDFTVYENVLLKAFLHEAIKHLNKRIKETADITKFFLSIFDPKEFMNNWADKIDRSNALVGRATKSDKSKDSGATNRVLSALKSELVKLEHAPLFDEFPKRISDAVVYHDTNVLNSHKHYKYLKILRLELKKLKETDEDQDPITEQQVIMNNMRTYVETLFVYTLRQMNYSVTGNKCELTAIHQSLPAIRLSSDKYGVLYISTEKTKIRVVTLGGCYDLAETTKIPHDTLCFCFSDYQKPIDNTGNIYFVNPIDTNSIECSGQVLRRVLVADYAETVRTKVDFQHSLRDYISAIDCKDVIFDTQTFSYSFGEEIPSELDPNRCLTKLKESPSFKQKNRREQDKLVKDMVDLATSINANCSIIKKRLVCPKCGNNYRVKSLRYLICNCGFICDISKDNHRFFHQQKEDSYTNITKKGWGMDLID